MGYSRKPNYHFNTKNDTGIDKVPEGRVIIVDDYDDSTTSGFDKVTKMFIKTSQGTLNSDSTIEDAAEIEIKSIGALDFIATYTQARGEL